MYIGTIRCPLTSGILHNKLSDQCLIVSIGTSSIIRPRQSLWLHEQTSWVDPRRKSMDKQSLMLAGHIFLGLPRLLFPRTLPRCFAWRRGHTTRASFSVFFARPGCFLFAVLFFLLCRSICWEPAMSGTCQHTPYSRCQTTPKLAFQPSFS